MTTPALIGSEAWRLRMIERLAYMTSAVTRRHRRPTNEKRLGSANSQAVSDVKPQTLARKGIDRESLPS
jgi:hypothetical protein